MEAEATGGRHISGPAIDCPLMRRNCPFYHPVVDAGVFRLAGIDIQDADKVVTKRHSRLSRFNSISMSPQASPGWR